MSISQRIAKRLTDIPMSRGALAKAVGVGRSAVSNWTSGGTSPDRSLIPKVAEALLTTTDYLLGVTDDPTPTSSSIYFPTDQGRAADGILGLYRMASELVSKLPDDMRPDHLQMAADKILERLHPVVERLEAVSFAMAIQAEDAMPDKARRHSIQPQSIQQMQRACDVYEAKHGRRPSNPEEARVALEQLEQQEPESDGESQLA